MGEFCPRPVKNDAADARDRRSGPYWPRHVALGALSAAAIIGCIATSLSKPRAVLVWNVSASAPKGLYRIAYGKPVRRGDTVVAWLPRRMRGLAARRQYLPMNVPLIKRVAGIKGDMVCGDGPSLTINGRMFAVRNVSDAAGRVLPSWNGCIRLRPDQFFLLSPHPWSFDGRYFGATNASEIIGKGELLWQG